MKINFILLVSILLCGFNSAAQKNCSLSLYGQIIDEHDASALGFSTLWLVNEKRGTAADLSGFYEFNDLCPGTYQVVISHIGCEPDTVLLELKQSMVANFQLEHHAEELKVIEIEGEEAVFKAGVEELSQASFNENSGKPLAEILTELNGVNSIQTGSNISKPMIGGLSNNRVKILNHGVQHQAQSWGDEHAPEIDPFAPADYSVVKGASALKYTGGAFGGLVIVAPKFLPQKVGFGGEVNALYSTNNRMGNTSVMFEGKSTLIPKLAARIQGSWKRSGNIKTPNYYQRNSGVKELNGSLDIGYFESQWNARIYFSQFNSDVGIFSGAHIGNLTDLQNAINLERPKPENIEGFSYSIRRPKQRIIHELAMAEFSWMDEKIGKFNFKFSRQMNIREEFDKETPRNQTFAALNFPELSLVLETFTANVNWTIETSKNATTEAGIQLVDLRNSLKSLRDFIPDYTGNDYSFYLIHKGKLKKVNWETGIRLEQSLREVNKRINREYEQFDLDFFTMNANLGLSYQFSKRLSTAWNATYSERAPEINELFSEGLHHGSASLEFGDQSIGKEKSFATGASIDYKIKRFSYKLYANIQWIEDFIYLEPQGLKLTIRGAFPSFNWSNTDALIKTLDQTITYQLSDKLQLQNELSFLWGINRSSDNYLINMPSNRIKSSITYAKDWKQEKRHLKVSIGNQVVFQQERFNEAEEIAPPPDGYQLVFANLTYQMSLKNKHQLEFGLRGDNLLNEVYRDYLNRFRFFTDEQGRNITVRIKYNF